MSQPSLLSQTDALKLILVGALYGYKAASAVRESRAGVAKLQADETLSKCGPGGLCGENQNAAPHIPPVSETRKGSAKKRPNSKNGNEKIAATSASARYRQLKIKSRMRSERLLISISSAGKKIETVL